LAGKAQDLENKGTRVLLRDEHDELVIMCNDGDYYCNVTNFDWTQQAALDLWLEEVHNASTVGGVDGIFADHAGHNIDRNGGAPQICNGSPKVCCNSLCWRPHLRSLSLSRARALSLSLSLFLPPFL
jgi:hypothetical protein